MAHPASTIATARSVLIDHGSALAESIGDLVPMTCIEAGVECPYGDVVPAGLLLAGLRMTDQHAAATTVAAWIAARRQDLGLPFHTGTLPTATDTALTLLGFQDDALVRGLDRFSDGGGGIVPQLLGAEDGRMRPHPALRHWEPADDLTTALTYHLRAVEGVPALTDAMWFAERFEQRASVFVASPWIVDWAWALAARSIPEPSGAALRSRLAAELFASANGDGSFGRPDERPLATAVAVAAGVALDDALPGDVVETGRLRLAEMVLDETPAQVPFVSSRRWMVGSDPLPGAPVRVGMAMLATGPEGLAAPGDEVHSLARYRDDSGAVMTGLALLALTATTTPASTTLERADPHPRYRCVSRRDYVERFALPPALRRAQPTSRSRRNVGSDGPTYR